MSEWVTDAEVFQRLGQIDKEWNRLQVEEQLWNEYIYQQRRRVWDNGTYARVPEVPSTRPAVKA